MKPAARLDFCQRAVALRRTHPDILYATITAKKQNVHAHIKTDSNKLYNFMIRLLLLDLMAKFEHVTLVPDPRTIKVQSGNSLHDYLQTELWFTKNALTKLSTEPEDSAGCLALQFADMLAGAVFRYHQDNDSAPWNVIAQDVTGTRLYF